METLTDLVMGQMLRCRNLGFSLGKYFSTRAGSEKEMKVRSQWPTILDSYFTSGWGRTAAGSENSICRQDGRRHHRHPPDSASTDTT